MSSSFIFWFDIVVLALVLVLGLKGIFNGLIKEISGLVGIIGGIFLASRIAYIVADMINKLGLNIQNQSITYVCGFVVVFVITWAISLLVGNLISKMVKLSSLGLLDRIGGFIFGASKIFCILAVVLSCMSNINFIKNYLKPLEQSSIVYDILNKTGDAVVRVDLFVKASNKAKQIIDNIEDDNIKTQEQNISQ